jgi:hypothetical protein
VNSMIGDRYFRLETELDLTPRLPPSMSAAQSFARVIPDSLQKAQQSLKTFVEGLGYSFAMGYRLTIGKQLEFSEESSDLDEQKYWQSLQGSVYQAHSLPNVIGALQDRTNAHAPTQYMCSFLKAYASAALF